MRGEGIARFIVTTSNVPHLAQGWLAQQELIPEGRGANFYPLTDDADKPAIATTHSPRAVSAYGRNRRERTARTRLGP